MPRRLLALALGAVAAAVGLAGSSSASSHAPALSPAFGVSALEALPTDGWITNGGSLANDRYSPLRQIAAGNVSKLKGVWHVHLKVATAGKYSAESQPIVYDGVMYLPAGNDDVFAIDVASGKFLWTYRSRISQKISTVCCGWTSRGVALGDGRVYLGQLDGSVVALDQRTGKVVWKTQIARWQYGYTITAAPLYYQGRVYTGISGGEFGIRGRLTALNAKTGRILWRFYTVPGPGQTGHGSWPRTGGAWRRGGAPIWNTPAVDPKLGLLYFSTGNTSPDFHGAGRAGANLFADSIVALNARTGRLRWWFQQVHHDIWDYDAPSPVLLFDARIGGRMRHGLAEIGKTGWVYLLDRRTGKPLLGIVERKVPQERSQATFATQPYPKGQAVVPQSITSARLKALQKALPDAPDRLVNGGRIFTPFSNGDPRLAAPGTLGGTNWPPSSYDPATRLIYVCAVDQAALFTGGTPQTPGPGKQLLGSAFVPAGKGSGVFAAVNVTTNRIRWRKTLNDICYSGSVATAGNIVFLGRNDGHLQALDARTGKLLWSFQTGAGANDTPTVFEQDGTEYVAFYAGGSALGATPHGDDVWLFALNGKLGPVETTGKGDGVLHTDQKPDATAGRKVFTANCTVCHGNLGQGGHLGPNLQTSPRARDLNQVVRRVENGGGAMPPFKNRLTARQIVDVAAYVTEKVAKPKPPA